MIGMKSFDIMAGFENEKLRKYKDDVERLIRNSSARATQIAYDTQLRSFMAWCSAEGLSPLPSSPSTIAEYIAALAKKKASVSTLSQSMAAIADAHRACGLDSPTDSLLIRKMVRGYKRKHRAAVRKKDAATADVIRKMLDALARDKSLRAARDRAIIAVGFMGAFRRSELAALNAEDIRWIMHGDREVALLTVGRSKTDQEGRGMVKAIFPSLTARYSPTRILQRWLKLSGIKSGPLFRKMHRGGVITSERLNGQSIRLAVIRAGRLAGLDLKLSAHSLRSGFVTTAIRLGRTERSIMNQTGHKSCIVLREYFIRESAMEDNAASDLM